MATRFPTLFGGRGLAGHDPFLDLNREINRLFDDVWRGASGGALMASPSIDVHETNDGLELTAELPGVRQEDIDIRLEGERLTLRGEKKSERKDEPAHLVERSYGSFQRQVQLPYAPDGGKVTASFEHGVLRIRLPRAPELDRSRRIQIGDGSSNGGSGAAAASAASGAAPEQPSAADYGATADNVGGITPPVGSYAGKGDPIPGASQGIPVSPAGENPSGAGDTRAD